MINENLDYRLLKVKNGKPFFAVINLEISLNENKNEILEEYEGEGWIRQGNIENVSSKGYNSWKKAAIKGLEFAFSKSNKNWKVIMKKIEGRIGTDTNPTIVGLATILAFCEQTKLELDSDLKDKVEDFTFKSWDNNNYERIPDFLNLKYDDIPFDQ